MNGNVDILKEGTSEFEVDLSAVVVKALRERKEREAAKYAEIEETPPDEVLTWSTTPEEIAQINAGNRAAIDRFYFDERNYKHIRCCAFLFFDREPRFNAVISIEDLMQQVYLDLATGLIKFRSFNRGISGAIFRSFRFAAVGGLDEVYVVKATRRKRKWANGKN